jgi:hypothetical protein
LKIDECISDIILKCLLGPSFSDETVKSERRAQIISGELDDRKIHLELPPQFVEEAEAILRF